jgi:hypothetical protein
MIIESLRSSRGIKQKPVSKNEGRKEARKEERKGKRGSKTQDRIG